MLLLLLPSQKASSQLKAVYNPKAVIPHAALLHQTSVHCAIFPTAASRRSLGRISVPMWPVALSGRLPVEALVSHYLTNKLIGRESIPNQKKSFQPTRCLASSYPVLATVSDCYPRDEGRLLTCYSPVRHSCTPERALPFDLHVLSTPPAFVLSQDQTLHRKNKNQTHPKTQAHPKTIRQKTQSPTNPHNTHNQMRTLQRKINQRKKQETNQKNNPWSIPKKMALT